MSYRDVNLHLVWAVKDRKPLLAAPIMDRLVKYAAGIVRNLDGEVYAFDGPDDHVHAVIALPAERSLAEMLREMKSRSSRWVHETFPELATFAWQDGYAAFSVSRSIMPRVIRYVETQREHHAKMTFEEEFKTLLEKHGIALDPKYL